MEIARFNELMLELDSINEVNDLLTEAAGLLLDNYDSVWKHIDSYTVKSFARKTLRAVARVSANDLANANELAKLAGFGRYVDGENVGVM